jgi:hypothetical protein
MSLQRHSRFVPVALLACLCAACVINVGADDVVVREEKRFSVIGRPEVTLDTFDGSIQVRSWDRDEVFVEIDKRGPDREAIDAITVEASQEGSRIRVQARGPRVTRHFVGIGNVSSPSASFLVSVPRQLTLNVRTADGSIAVAQVNGVVDVRSADGSITGDDLTGEISMSTEDGSVRVTDAEGSVVLNSGDGSIQVTGRLDTLRVRTGDGSVVIEAAEGSTMKSDWDVTTGDGSIVFRVPGGFNAEIDAHSDDGSVRAEQSLRAEASGSLERVQREDGRESLRGRLGSGGHAVKLRSGDGSIRVVER